MNDFTRCVLTCLVILAAGFCTTGPCYGLVFSEIMYDPPGDDDTLEFIEIYNDRAVFEDMGGWEFTNGISYTFASGTILEAGKYLVIAKDPAALEAAYGITGVLGPYSGRLNNDGERITLSEPNEPLGTFNQAIVLTVGYNDKAPWPRSAKGAGHSLVLRKLAGDPEEGTTWTASTYIGGSPGESDEVNSEPASPETIDLVQPGDPGRYFKGVGEPTPAGNGDPTTDWTQINFNDDPTTTDWIDGDTGYGYSSDPGELQTVHTILSDMQNGYLSIYARIPFALTSKQINSLTQLQAQLYYDDAFVLYLNGRRVGDSGNIGGNPPAFDADPTTSSDYGPRTIDLSSYINLLVVGKNVLAIQGHNTSYSSSDFVVSPVLRGVTVASTGDDPQGRLLINEVLANSDTAPATDWVELFNPGPIAMTLTDIWLSDEPDNLLKYQLPAGAVMQPGSFIAIREGTAPDGFPFGLDFRGETLYLTVATPGPSPEPIRVLDAFRYRNMAPEDTFGRYPDGSDNLAILSAATFGTPNTQPRTGEVVINELMYHHGSRDERYEYVELYNRSDATVSLAGWEFTDGISYTFGNVWISPGACIVVAKDPNLLEITYPNLTRNVNLFGPYDGELNDHSERLELSYPIIQLDPNTHQPRSYLIVTDEVTYYDGGRWPQWADGMGASMELRDPDSDNAQPDAWADSDESNKSTWQQFERTISSTDSYYTHDSVDVFDMMLLNRGEALIDDVKLTFNGIQQWTDDEGGFESKESSWRLLGNHVRSYVTTEDPGSGSAHQLHVIATGHGDPGANRVNRSIYGVTGTVRFQFKARWLRGTQHILLRTTRQQSPVQPPRPSYSFTLPMPMNLGTPGAVNTAYIANNGPSINEVAHDPVLPGAGQPITVTARVADNDGVSVVTLYYRSEGTANFYNTPMRDNGQGGDVTPGDGLYTGIIPGAAGGTMRSFYIIASDGSAETRFPTAAPVNPNVPERLCLVRIGDSQVSTPFNTYRLWLSNEVINIFTHRPNLSNELMDCTFVYNDQEVFYNVKVRFRGSPFLRSGSNRNPTDRYAFRIDFNPDQKFRTREEVNLDNTEGTDRGPVQERCAYWFYNKMGLQYCRQEYVKWIANGNVHDRYEDIHKIDGDYVDLWFPHDNDGYLHKIDDYFEYSADGTGFSNKDEGLLYDSRHPLIPETYRWGFEKRSHRENDQWSHLLNFAQKMNTAATSSLYESNIESVVHPRHLATVLAIRHMVGDWDSYGFTRGKNNWFYYAPDEGKWYLLPWDIDFAFGAGRPSSSDIFEVSDQFPEIVAFLNHDTYRRMYLAALAELVGGPWQTSYGTANPPTEFDKFLDDAADQQVLDNGNDGRRNTIKQYVRDRRDSIINTYFSNPIGFAITTNGGENLCTGYDTIKLVGVGPVSVSRIAVNGTLLDTQLSGQSAWCVEVPLVTGDNVLHVTGYTSSGFPVDDAEDTITITKAPPSTIESITPDSACNVGLVDVTISGENLSGASAVSLLRVSDDIGFDALHVLAQSGFDRIEAAKLLLDNPDNSVQDAVYSVYNVLNISNERLGEGIFKRGEACFTYPYYLSIPNFAVRFTGYIYAPSPGIRYFGVNCDDGFVLMINNQVVGEYANLSNGVTTDPMHPGTAGTMSFDFPTAGAYFLEMDYFFTTGTEAVELFQTDEYGNDPHLINVDAELVVYRANATRIEATNINVVNDHTVTCRFDLNNATAGLWNLELTPDCGPTAMARLIDAMQVISCRADIDGSNRVDFVDLALLAGRWLNACAPLDDCSGADLNESGSVDAEDIAILADEWLMTDP